MHVNNDIAFIFLDQILLLLLHACSHGLISNRIPTEPMMFTLFTYSVENTAPHYFISIKGRLSLSKTTLLLQLTLIPFLRFTIFGSYMQVKFLNFTSLDGLSTTEMGLMTN